MRYIYAKNVMTFVVLLVSRYCSGIGQYRVGDYYLDGFRELPGGCREFYGCYYHGCDVCYMDRSRAVRCKSWEQGYVTVDNVWIDMFEHERMTRSLAKFDCNKDKWITLWEHEFNERFEEFKLVLGEEVINSLPDRLDPRNAVKGGRTEVFKMHTKVTDVDSQVIHYLDLNSLYLYVMSKTKFSKLAPHDTLRSWLLHQFNE